MSDKSSSITCFMLLLGLLTLTQPTIAQRIASERILIFLQDADLVQSFPDRFTPLAEIEHLDSGVKNALAGSGVTHIRRLVNQPLIDYSAKQVRIADLLHKPTITTSNIAVRRSEFPAQRGTRHFDPANILHKPTIPPKNL